MSTVAKNTKVQREKIFSLLENSRKQKFFPGSVVGFVSKNSEPVIVSSGYQTYAPDAISVKNDTIYDVASITKSIPTTALALYLCDQKLLKLSDPVVNFIPEMNHMTHKQIAVFHLLTQSIDLQLSQGLAVHQEKSPNDILQTIFQAPIKKAPGSSYLYANATSILLGLVVERVSGKSLDVFANEIFFNPLGMTHTSFHPEKFKKTDIAPTEIQGEKLIHGIVHDESARKLQQKRIVGSAGLFSTVPDLLLFVSMLLQKGTIGGKQFFSEEIIKQMASNQLENISEHAGLGWELNERKYIGRFASDKTISKTGFTGCVVAIDLQKGAGLVMLSNYTYPKRKADYMPLQRLRSEIADIIFE